MERAEVIDLEFGICQPCPGVWYYPETPTEQLEAGLLLSRSDFREACLTTGLNFGNGTYAFHQLIFSLERLYRDECYTDTFYGLKSPLSKKTNSFYVETQAAHDMFHKSTTGRNLLIGYGPNALNTLAAVLFDEPEIYF